MFINYLFLLAVFLDMVWAVLFFGLYIFPGESECTIFNVPFPFIWIILNIPIFLFGEMEDLKIAPFLIFAGLFLIHETGCFILRRSFRHFKTACFSTIGTIFLSSAGLILLMKFYGTPDWLKVAWCIATVFAFLRFLQSIASASKQKNSDQKKGKSILYFFLLLTYRICFFWLFI